MTSSIVLYGNRPLSSPYVLAAFVALEEKGLPYELRLLDLNEGEHGKPEYTAASLTARVPSLVHDGFWLSESSAICEYLEDSFAPPEYPALYPRDLRERARVRMVQALVRTDFLPIRLERSTDTVFHGAAVQPLSAAALASVDRLYRVASQLVGDGRGSIASSFSIADVDLAMMLQRLLANRDAIPEPLASYARGIWERPSVQKWLARVRKS
ncbi:MAG TPA: glutathione transferase [Polyangiales bacterium]|nr:glutathione transferase [Polyangiales bacterium]